ncbi:hypothetical protein CDAR_410801 [Caerostris darwini]|uniref:Uncharacterized protein n=1 Tax=Caerostris darwini TaxID=1538125 RepID=A0AAV4SEN5_9ARAC|nr:hypothetical protein CDAR_410801 [Caerostris darwini]
MPIETKYTIIIKHLSGCAQNNNHQYVQSHNVVHYQETSFSNLEQGHCPVHPNQTAPVYLSKMDQGYRIMHPNHASPSKLILQGIPNMISQAPSSNLNRSAFPLYPNQNSSDHPLNSFPNRTVSRCPSKLHHQGPLPVHLNLTFPTYNSTQSNDTQTTPAFSSSSGQRHQVVSPNKTTTVFPSISDQCYHTVRPPHQNLSPTPSCFHQDYCSARPKKEVSADSSRFECYPRKKLLVKWEKTTEETLSILNNSTEVSCFDQDPASIIPKKRLRNKWNQTTNETFSKLDNSSATKPKKRLLSRWNQHTVKTFSNLNNSTEVTCFDQDHVSIIPKKRLLNRWNQTTNIF